MEELQEILMTLGYFDTNINDCLLPCSYRLEFQEKLLERLEPGILSDPDLNLPGTTQLSRLNDIYTDLGIHSTPDIIQGNCPQSASVRLLIDLCTLIKPNNITIAQCQSYLNYIAENPCVFSNDVKLFPNTFPSKYSNPSSVHELQQILEYWNQEYYRLNLHSRVSDDKTTPQTSDLISLKDSIEQFSTEIRSFRKNYELDIQKYIGEGVEINRGIGKWSKDCAESYEKLRNLFVAIEDIWNSINSLTKSQ
jgi:hypothetical protein